MCRISSFMLLTYIGKSPEMVETCYASCRPACKSTCIDDEYALLTVQEIICGKVCEPIVCTFSAAVPAGVQLELLFVYSVFLKVVFLLVYRAVDLTNVHSNLFLSQFLRSREINLSDARAFCRFLSDI